MAAECSVTLENNIQEKRTVYFVCIINDVINYSLDKTVLFRCISTEVGDQVYILLFNSCVKFHSEIFTHC